MMNCRYGSRVLLLRVKECYLGGDILIINQYYWARKNTMRIYIVPMCVSRWSIILVPEDHGT